MIVFYSLAIFWVLMTFVEAFSSCVLRPASCVSHSISISNSKSRKSSITLKSSSVTCDEFSPRLETESESHLIASRVVTDRFATQDAGRRTQDRFELATQDAGRRTQDRFELVTPDAGRRTPDAGPANNVRTRPAKFATQDAGRRTQDESITNTSHLRQGPKKHQAT